MGEKGASTKSVVVATALGMLTVCGVILGYVRYKKGGMDEPCEIAFGCVSDAVCLSRTRSSEGYCYAPCSDARPCGSRHECRRMDGLELCQPVAFVGESCAGT